MMTAATMQAVRAIFRRSRSESPGVIERNAGTVENGLMIAKSDTTQSSKNSIPVQIT